MCLEPGLPGRVGGIGDPGQINEVQGPPGPPDKFFKELLVDNCCYLLAVHNQIYLNFSFLGDPGPPGKVNCLEVDYFYLN